MAAPGENRIKSWIGTVREMRSSDVPAVSAILKESLAASDWSADSLLDAARSGTAWVSEDDGRVIGFLIGRSVADEFEILNLVLS